MATPKRRTKPEEREWALQMHKKGWKIKAIALSLGLNDRTIFRWIKEASKEA